MLAVNNTYASRLRFFGDNVAALADARTRSGWSLMNQVAFGKYTSKPAGYGNHAMALPVGTGGIGAWDHGSVGAGITSIEAWGSPSATITAAAAGSAAATALKDAAAQPAGSGTLASAMVGRGTISAAIRIGFQPSAEDVYYTLLDTPNTVDGLSIREALRVLTAVLAGKVSGASTGSPVFRSVDDVKPRVTAETDANGNRTSVTIDAG